MIKRPFLGVVKPRLYYNVVPDEVEELPAPKKVTLLLKNGRKEDIPEYIPKTFGQHRGLLLC